MPSRRPPLTIKQVLAWADAHHARTGRWPTEESGPVVDAPSEVWQNVGGAMKNGWRGLSGKRTLAQLLVEERGVRKRAYAPRLTVKTDETWIIIDLALQKGIRGLPISSLARLLAQHRGVPNRSALPRLTLPQILAWADDHKQRTRKWPSSEGGLLDDAPAETWEGVNRALYVGLRGLPGGTSVAQLLAKERQVRNQVSVPPLTEAQISRWAEEHHRRTGK